MAVLRGGFFHAQARAVNRAPRDARAVNARTHALRAAVNARTDDTR